MKRWHKSVFMVTFLTLFATACRASSPQNGIEKVEKFPARALHMAMTLNQDLNRRGVAAAFKEMDRKSIVRRFGDDMARIFLVPTTNGGSYLSAMATASAYCQIKLTRGSSCGVKKFLPESESSFNGYLYVSDWIRNKGRRYFLMIISSTGPPRTIIARVTYRRGISVLYDTFAKNERCPLPPVPPVSKTPGLFQIKAVYRVETLSPTSFELYEGGYTGPGPRLHVLHLSVGDTSCALKVVSP